MAGYYTLKPEQGLLKGIKLGPDKEVAKAECERAEKWAQRQIEEYLGKRWDTASPPESIADLAEELASAYLLKRVERNNPEAIKRADKIESDARKELHRIRSGQKGIKLPDGSWDPKYVGNHNREEGRQGRCRILF